MANKKISQLSPSGKNFRDIDLVEGEASEGGNSVKYTGTQLRAVEKAERIAVDNAIIGGVGLDTDGSYIAPVGTTHLDATTSVMDALETLDGVTGGATSAGALNIVNVSDGAGGFIATSMKIDTQRILADDPTLRDASNATFTPTKPDSMVTKKYVDDNDTLSNLEYVYVTANYAATATDYAIYAGGANITVTLPSAAANEKKAILIRRDDTAFTLTVTAVEATDDISHKGLASNSIAFGTDENWMIFRATQSGADWVWIVEAYGGDFDSRTTSLRTASYNVPSTQENNIINTALFNVQATLPQISTVGSTSFSFRNTDNGTTSGNAATIFRAGTDTIYFDGVSYQGITSSTDGAWVQLASSGSVWYVVMGGENFTGIV